MSELQNIPDFNQMAREMLKDAPKDISERARAFFLSSFTKEGWTDASFIPWQKRVDTTLSHKILQSSLALKNSIKITQATLNRIEITAGEGIPYAAIHNNGGTITVPVTQKMKKFFWYKYKSTGDEYWKNAALTKKEHFTIKILKRQFIGDSYTLNQEIGKWMSQNILKAEKNLKFK